MVCVGTRDILGDTKEPIEFSELLELPIISLRHGISTRAILDDTNLLKKIESRARLQLNSIQAIAGSLGKGLGCIIGNKLFMQDQLTRGTLEFRPIVNPELRRTLYLCELTARPPTFALEAVRKLINELIIVAVENEIWEARLLKDSRNIDEPIHK